MRRYLLFLLCGCALPALAQFRYHGVISGRAGLEAPSHVIVSPDNRHVYVAGAGDHTIAVFSRDPQSGGLDPLGEVTDGQGGVDGLAGVRQLAISADGRFLYAVADQDHALSVFSRNEDGLLTFVEVHKDGVGGVDGLGGARALAISPDDDNIYVAASGDHAVSVFLVDSLSGRITFEEAVFDEGPKGATKLTTANSVAVSPDGQHVYVTGHMDNGLSAFSRNTAQRGTLEVVQNIENWAFYILAGEVRPTGIATSSDGQHVYVTGYGGSSAGNLTYFSRDPASGQLTIVQRFTDDSSLDDRFIRLQDFGRLTSVALSLDQRFVFTTGDNSPGADDFKILSFTRDLNTGSLATFQGIKNNQGGVTGLENPRALAFSQDGNFFYVVSLENALTIYSLFFPEVTSLTPQEGFPGEEVTITGTDFGSKFAGDTVMFGAVGARVKSWSNEAITVYVPEMAGGSTEVTVTVNGQSSAPQSFRVKSSSSTDHERDTVTCCLRPCGDHYRRKLW